MINTLYYLTLDIKDTSIAIWKQSNDHRNGVLRVKREQRWTSYKLTNELTTGSFDSTRLYLNNHIPRSSS